MKIWLNNLKEGDIFYYIVLHTVLKCKHLGNANNIDYKMPMIKFKILEGWPNELINILGDEHELFVNKYVYDNEEEARINLKIELKDELLEVQYDINKTFQKLNELKEKELEIRKLLTNE